MVCYTSLEICGEVSTGDSDLGILGTQMKFKARGLTEITSRLCVIDKGGMLGQSGEHLNIKIYSREAVDWVREGIVIEEKKAESALSRKRRE